MQNVYTDGRQIEVTPFDLLATGESYKIDLLFYNNVNKHGEILTSLVYNSGLRSSDNVYRIQYDPSKLYNNTEFEQSYTFVGGTETSNRWKNSDLLTNGLSLIKDKTYTASSDYSTYDITTDFASDYKNGTYSYDGWYTFVSLAVIAYADSETVPAGTIRVSNSVLEYALVDNPATSDDWSLLEEIDPTIPIYNILRTEGVNIYQSQDFMVTTKTYSLYKHLLDNKLDSTWFVKLDALGPKIKTLESAIEHKKYDIAQHVLNSINNSLLAILI